MEKIEAKCPFPDCGQGYITNELIKELRIVQDNQKVQEDIQRGMYNIQARDAGVDKDIFYIKEDLRKIDSRITQLFQEVNARLKTSDVIPKENIVTKDDMSRFMRYTILVVTASVGFMNWIFYMLRTHGGIAEWIK